MGITAALWNAIKQNIWFLLLLPIASGSGVFLKFLPETLRREGAIEADQGGDQRGGRDIEGRIASLEAFGDMGPTLETEKLGYRPLFNEHILSACQGARVLHQGIERDAMFFGHEGYRIGPHFVDDIAILGASIRS